MYFVKKVKFGNFIGYAVNDINKLVLNYDHLIYMYDIKKLPKITVITSDKNIYPVTIFEIYLVTPSTKYIIQKYINILISNYKINIVNLSVMQLTKNEPVNLIECENYDTCANVVNDILIIKDKEYNRLNNGVNQIAIMFILTFLYSVIISCLFMYLLSKYFT
jgi:hypothetical protein